MLIKNCNQRIYFISSDRGDFSPVLTKAKGKRSFCITASSIKEKVSVGGFYAREMYTDEFLKTIPDGVDVLFVGDSGGVYYSSDELKCL